MPPPAVASPLRSSKFRVEIDGLAPTAFLSVSGIEVDATVVDYRPGSDPTPGVQKLPGAIHFSNVTLTRGLTADLSLWNWMNETVAGNVSRRNMSVVLQSEAGNDIIRFNFKNAFPVKWVGPSLDSEGNEIASEVLEIAHEQLTVVAV